MRSFKLLIGLCILFDSDTGELKDLKPFGIENDIILNPDLLRAAHYAKLLLKNKQNMQIVGHEGT